MITLLNCKTPSKYVQIQKGARIRSKWCPVSIHPEQFSSKTLFCALFVTFLLLTVLPEQTSYLSRKQTIHLFLAVLRPSAEAENFSRLSIAGHQNNLAAFAHLRDFFSYSKLAIDGRVGENYGRLKTPWVVLQHPRRTTAVFMTDDS